MIQKLPIFSWFNAKNFPGKLHLWHLLSILAWSLRIAIKPWGFCLPLRCFEVIFVSYKNSPSLNQLLSDELWIYGPQHPVGPCCSFALSSASRECISFSLRHSGSSASWCKGCSYHSCCIRSWAELELLVPVQVWCSCAWRNSKSGFIFFCPGREFCFNQHLLITLSPDSIIVCFASALIPEEKVLLKLGVSQYPQFFQMLCDRWEVVMHSCQAIDVEKVVAREKRAV